MKLQTVRGVYEGSTSVGSDTTRKLNFAGIAVVWIFRPETGGALGIQSIPFVLLVGLALFVLSLGADLSQYLYAAAVWGAAQSILETAKVAEETEFKAPAWMNWPTWTLFWLKVALCVAGYLFVSCHLIFRIIDTWPY